MSSPFHHELGMFVKDRVGLRPSFDRPLVGRKEKGRQLGIERGDECWPSCSSDWVCSEFDTRSIGFLISINAGIQNAAHTNRVQTLKGRLVEAESRTQLRGKLNSSAGCPTSLSDLTEFVWNQRTSRCGAS